MGGTVSGGDPAKIADGGAALTKASTSVSSRAEGLRQAGTKGAGSGNDALTAALSRFTAASGQFTTDLGTQLTAAGTLATSASHDLVSATSGPRPR